MRIFKIIKAIILWKKIEAYLERNSPGCYGYSFQIGPCSGRGGYEAIIKLPFPKGERIDVETYEMWDHTLEDTIIGLYKKLPK